MAGLVRGGRRPATTVLGLSLATEQPNPALHDDEDREGQDQGRSKHDALGTSVVPDSCRTCCAIKGFRPCQALLDVLDQYWPSAQKRRGNPAALSSVMARGITFSSATLSLS